MSEDSTEQDADFEQSTDSSGDSSGDSAGNSHQGNVQNETSATAITTMVYALQALSFLLGITFIAAVVVNYVKRADVEGTWLESHFRWQIRTFWFAVLWSVLGFITWVFLIGMLVLGINAVWIIYRIVRGWINLAERKPMYE